MIGTTAGGVVSAPDFAALAASIARCDAVYEVDDALARSTFSALGCEVAGRYSSDTAQAILHIAPDGVLTLTIAGTRFSEGKLRIRAEDVLQDAEEIFVNCDIGGGCIVASGAHDRGVEIWTWAKPLVAGRALRVEGHSLGGQTTIVLRAIIPPTIYASGIAWESPKAANDNFYAQYLPDQSVVLSIINGRDFWAAHPIESQTLRHAPGPILHIASDNTWTWLTRDTLPLAVILSDHDSDKISLVVQEIANAG